MPTKQVQTYDQFEFVFTPIYAVGGDVTIGQFINNVNLTEVQQQILSLSLPQVIDLPIELRGTLVISGNLNLVNDTIDGYQLSQDLVKLEDISSIDGMCG